MRRALRYGREDTHPRSKQNNKGSSIWKETTSTGNSRRKARNR